VVADDGRARSTTPAGLTRGTCNLGGPANWVRSVLHTAPVKPGLFGFYPSDIQTRWHFRRGTRSCLPFFRRSVFPFRVFIFLGFVVSLIAPTTVGAERRGLVVE
jgi:hypothetical protein